MNKNIEKTEQSEKNSKIDKLIADNKKRGFVTYDEVNKALPDNKQISVDDIEDVISKFSDDAGIDIIEEDSDDGIKLDIDISKELTFHNKLTDNTGEPEEEETDAGPTDDPVRLYLRDMSGVDLLSRANEVEIAKRIDEGKVQMRKALCESTIAMKSFIKLYEDLVNEKIALRELIDLEANLGLDKEVNGGVKIPSTETQTALDDSEHEDGDEDEEDSNSLTIVAMEQELMPSILDKMERIANLASEILVITTDRFKNNTKSSLHTNKKYNQKLHELTEEFSGIIFHNNKIDDILKEIYTLNREIVAKEASILKLAEKHGINRKEFLKEHKNNIINEEWRAKILSKKTVIGRLFL